MTAIGARLMLPNKKIWIIEDIVDLHGIYQEIFCDKNQFTLTFFKSFDDFKSAYSSHPNSADLIIADIMLEDGHFFKLLNESDITLDTAYMIISSSDEIDTIRQAFEVGAIDYILKPLRFNEVRGKVEKHLIELEERNYETSKSLKALKLDFNSFTNKEIRIIESFNSKDDKVLHRNEIVKIIWKNITIHPNTLDVHIYNLRKKLKAENYTIKAIGNGLFKFMNL